MMNNAISNKKKWSWGLVLGVIIAFVCLSGCGKSLLECMHLKDETNSFELELLTYPTGLRDCGGVYLRYSQYHYNPLSFELYVILTNQCNFPVKYVVQDEELCTKGMYFGKPYIEVDDFPDGKPCLYAACCGELPSFPEVLTIHDCEKCPELQNIDTIPSVAKGLEMIENGTKVLSRISNFPSEVFINLIKQSNQKCLEEFLNGYFSTNFAFSITECIDQNINFDVRDGVKGYENYFYEKQALRSMAYYLMCPNLKKLIVSANDLSQQYMKRCWSVLHGRGIGIPIPILYKKEIIGKDYFFYLDNELSFARLHINYGWNFFHCYPKKMYEINNAIFKQVFQEFQHPWRGACRITGRMSYNYADGECHMHNYTCQKIK